jgi:hypothetical protein
MPDGQAAKLDSWMTTAFCEGRDRGAHPLPRSRKRDSFNCDQVRRVAKRDLFPIAGDAICAVAADCRALKLPWFLPDGRRFLFCRHSADGIGGDVAEPGRAPAATCVV